MWDENTNSFCKSTEDQGDHVCPCLISYAEDELYAQAKGEESTEKGIGAEIGVVAVDSELGWTVDADGRAVVG